MENKENMIEFITNSHTATVTFTNEKDINRMKKLYEENKDEFTYFRVNNDGSVCAKIPRKWIKVSPPKKMSDEAKQAASERFKKMWQDKQS